MINDKVLHKTQMYWTNVKDSHGFDEGRWKEAAGENEDV